MKTRLRKSLTDTAHRKGQWTRSREEHFPYLSLGRYVRNNDALDSSPLATLGNKPRDMSRIQVPIAYLMACGKTMRQSERNVARDIEYLPEFLRDSIIDRVNLSQ